MPNASAGEGDQGWVGLLTDLVYCENLTLRGLAAIVVGSHGHRILVGTAGIIADDFQYWLEEGGVDGFSTMPAVMPEQLPLSVELVIPELHRRRLFREEYKFSTLRENFGLPESDFNHQS